MAFRATTKKRYSDTTIQEPEPGTGTWNRAQFMQIRAFCTTGDIMIIIYRGRGRNSKIVQYITSETF
jgi:hypothetical protein